MRMRWVSTKERDGVESKFGRDGSKLREGRRTRSSRISTDGEGGMTVTDERRFEWMVQARRRGFDGGHRFECDGKWNVMRVTVLMMNRREVMVRVV
jgi:hypothetical protein